VVSFKQLHLQLSLSLYRPTVVTWTACRPDATLREIADLVQNSNTDAQKPSKRLSICVVSETRDGR
jgi:hypothetical protein